MSNWKVGPGGRLYHPTTGAYVGQLDDNGNEQLVLSAFPSAQGVGSSGIADVPGLNVLEGAEGVLAAGLGDYGNYAIAPFKTRSVPAVRRKVLNALTSAPVNGSGNGTISMDADGWLTFTTNGTASSTFGDIAAAFDSTGYAATLEMLIPEGGLAKISEINLYVGKKPASTFQDYAVFSIKPGTAPWLKEGEVQLFTGLLANVTTSGAFTRDGNTHIRLRVIGNNGEEAVVKFRNYGKMKAINAAFPRGVFLPSCDDGKEDWRTVCAPELAKNGWRMTGAIIPRYVGRPTYLSDVQLRELIDVYGWDIIGHDDYYMHEAPFTTSDADVVNCWLAVKDYLRRIGAGSGADHMAYPGGRQTARIQRLLRPYFVSCRTIEGMAKYPETIPPANPLALRAISSVTSYAGGNSPANVKLTMDAARAEGGVCAPVFHDYLPAGSTPTATRQCIITDVLDLYTYAETIGLEILTYPEYFDRLIAAGG